jgi:hypothetical protein
VPAEFTITTITHVTPVRYAFGHRVKVGARALAKRSTPGLIGIAIRRGDGQNPESYTYTVAYEFFGPVLAGEEIKITLAEHDQVGAGTYPRRYQLRVEAIGGVAVINVRDANIGTSPYSQPGLVQP